MQNNIIETIDHNGFTIQIIPDYDYEHDDDGMGQLHCDSRDFYIGAIRKDGREVKAPVTLKYSVADMLDILKASHVFYGSFGSHSGVWLNSMRGEINPKELEKLAKALYKKEYPTKKDREYMSFEDFLYEIETRDVIEPEERNDVLLIIPSDLWGNTKQSAHDIGKNCWKYWDDIIRGNVYGFNIVDKDGDSIDDVEYNGGACYGFVGDVYNYRAKKPEDRDGHMIKYAKSIIDSINSSEYYTAKYKKQIADHENAIKKLSEKIS